MCIDICSDSMRNQSVTTPGISATSSGATEVLKTFSEGAKEASDETVIFVLKALEGHVSHLLELSGILN